MLGTRPSEVLTLESPDRVRELPDEGRDKPSASPESSKGSDSSWVKAESASGEDQKSPPLKPAVPQQGSQYVPPRFRQQVGDPKNGSRFS